MTKLKVACIIVSMTKFHFDSILINEKSYKNVLVNYNSYKFFAIVIMIY